MLRTTAFGYFSTLTVAAIILGFVLDNWARILIWIFSLVIVFCGILIMRSALKTAHANEEQAIIPESILPSWRNNREENAATYDAIRSALESGKTQAAVAKEFGTYPAMVSKIKKGLISKEEFFRLTSR